MRNNKSRRFWYIFSIIILFDLLVLSIPEIEYLRIFSKPLILISLIAYFISSGIRYSMDNSLIIFALLFSLLGDILLLFEDKSEMFFIGGLLSFLLVHILYSIVFIRQKKDGKPPYIIGIILLSIGISLFSFIREGLGDLMLPVMIYTSVILCMVFLAFYRTNSTANNSYNYVLIGAILFMISDSLLAIDKFRVSFIAASQFIILTYALAQYLIVLGLKTYKNG